MKKHVLCLLAALVLGAFAPAARANTYDITFTGSVFDVTAQVVTDPFDDVTSITGLVTGPNGAAISGLEPLNTQGSWNYDNLLFSSVPYVSNGGPLFKAGAFDYNLYSVGSGPGVNYYLSTFNPDGTLYNPGDSGTLTVSPVPLHPSQAANLTLLAVGLAFIAWRRRNPRDSVAAT